MATAGRRRSDDDLNLSRGGDEDYELDCDSCLHDGNFVPAAGYCINCEDFLCTACLKIHCKPTPLKSHVLLDQNHMPKQKPKRQPKQICTELCTDHPNEAVKFYCKEHDDVGCNDCVVLIHQNCTLDYIPAIAEDFGSSAEYKATVQKLTDIRDKIRNIIVNTDKDAKRASKEIDNALTDIKQRRQMMNAYFDKAEQLMEDKCKHLNTSNQTELQKVKQDLVQHISDVSKIQTQLSSNLNMTADLFVRTKRSREKLNRVCNSLDSLKDVDIRTLKFKVGINLTPGGKVDEIYGKLKETDLYNGVSEMSLGLSTLIKVNAFLEKKCYITGITYWRQNMIACTDWVNSNVKIMDLTRKEIVDKISVDQAWDITVVLPDKLAITCPEKTKIQLLTMTPKLSKSGSIGVDGKCRGIDCIGNMLAVSFIYPPKVEILDLSGTVLKLIKTDPFGKPLFLTPYYIALSPDCKSVYVSDDEIHAILKLTLDGSLIATCKNQRIVNPRGLAVCEDGRVIIGSSSCPKVFAMSPDCRRVVTLLRGFFMHKAVCVMEDRNQVVVSNGPGGPHLVESEIGLYNIYNKTQETCV